MGNKIDYSKLTASKIVTMYESLASKDDLPLGNFQFTVNEVGDQYGIDDGDELERIEQDLNDSKMREFHFNYWDLMHPDGDGSHVGNIERYLAGEYADGKLVKFWVHGKVVYDVNGEQHLDKQGQGLTVEYVHSRMSYLMSFRWSDKFGIPDKVVDYISRYLYAEYLQALGLKTGRVKLPKLPEKGKPRFEYSLFLLGKHQGKFLKDSSALTGKQAKDFHALVPNKYFVGVIKQAVDFTKNSGDQITFAVFRDTVNRKLLDKMREGKLLKG